jgi:uncharacterized NAD-dependent epimerase/dehydratase family protein
MHGSCPEALVLCHQAGRTHMKLGDSGTAPNIRPLPDVIRDNERAAGWVRPAAVTGLSINTMMLDDEAARLALEHASQLTGLPAVDPVRYGVDALATQLTRRVDQRKRLASADRTQPDRPGPGGNLCA